ncbi:MAG: hypothetical protein AAFP19_02235 [Bacteroidota bacterium]
MKQTLSLAIALDLNHCPHWQYSILMQIQQDDRLKISYLIHTPNTLVPEVGGLWQWHLALDQKRFLKGEDAQATRDVQTLLAGVPQLDWAECKGAAPLRDHQAALLLWWSEAKIPNDWYAYFPCGIWFYLHGDHQATSAKLLGYWEFMKMEEVISSALVIRRRAEEGGQMVQRSWSMMPSLAIAQAKNEHLWKIQAFVHRSLEQLLQLGQEAFFKHLYQEKKPLNGQLKQQAKAPHYWEALLNLGRHGSRLAHKVWRKLQSREQWILLLHLGQSPSTKFGQFKKILPPKDRFWADPFLIEQAGQHYLFFEELLYATDKGHICVMEIDEEGKHSDPIRILEKDYHLSYPFVFEYQEQYYLIPESYQSGRIELYECTRFPDQWQHKMNLMENLCAMDTTLIEYQGKWWLFSAITAHRSASHHDELCLFYADHPLSQEWTPHPQNPIVSDVRSARPAGNIYWSDGKLIRPSQDCARKYGFGFRLNEIEILNETEYREKCILHVRPDWDPSLRRTHTYVHQPGMTLIDGLIQRNKWW